MATPTYTVRWTEPAVRRLKSIPDRRIQRAIRTSVINMNALRHRPPPSR
jgi:hypothetical protein